MMKIEKTVNILNRRARFEYEILEEYEAGMVLTGTEIKSLRSSKASITESFCQFIDGELYIINMMIDEYKSQNKKGTEIAVAQKRINKT